MGEGIRIVGLGGRARSGKDSVANHLAARHGWHIRSFAAPLKEAARALFGLTPEQTDGELKEDIDIRWGRSPREILQHFGTDIMRKHWGEGIWIQSMAARIQSLAAIAPGSCVVIPDVRFYNEANWIRQAGGTLIRCVCPDGLSLTGATSQHASETGLDDYSWDYVISAKHGQLPVLYRQAEQCLRLYGGE